MPRRCDHNESYFKVPRKSVLQPIADVICYTWTQGSTAANPPCQPSQCSSLKQYVNITHEKKQVGTLQSDAQVHLMEAWWRGTKTWMLSHRNRAGCHESLVASCFPPQQGWVFVERLSQPGCLLLQLGDILSLRKGCMGRDACAPVAYHRRWAGFYDEDIPHGLHLCAKGMRHCR